MGVELVVRRGADRLTDKLMAKSGLSSDVTPAQRKQEEMWLKQTARHKVWLPVSVETLIGSQLHEQSVKQGAIVPEDQINVRDRRRLDQVKGFARPTGRPASGRPAVHLPAARDQ
jgi:hypothetical protein